MRSFFANWSLESLASQVKKVIKTVDSAVNTAEKIKKASISFSEYPMRDI